MNIFSVHFSIPEQHEHFWRRFVSKLYQLGMILGDLSGLRELPDYGRFDKVGCTKVIRYAE